MEKLTADLLFDCATDIPKMGLDGSKAVIINYDDIDFSASTTSGSTITALATKSGTAGFDAVYYKELASVASAFTANAEDVDGFSHSFNGRIMLNDAASADRAAELRKGRFVVVVETSYKGTSEAEAFKVFGWESGLELSETAYNSLENSGSMTFVLSTREGTVERYPYMVNLQTDYATTKAEFDAKYATA